MPKLKSVFFLLLFSIALKGAYLLLNITFSEEPLYGTIFDKYIQTTRKNDAYWYQKIAENGYSVVTKKIDLGYANAENFKQSEWAFFPFYPKLIASMKYGLGMEYASAAFLLSLLFSFLSLVGMYWFGLIFLKNEENALFAALILFCFPFAFYFSMFYTEALFFTFLVFSFIAVHYKKQLLLSFLLVPLILLRPNGLFLLIPLYVYYLEQNNLFVKKKIDWQNLMTKKTILTSLAFTTGPIAFAYYCFYQYQMTGFPFAFSIAQAGWYREFMFPLLAFFRKGDLATQFNSIYSIVAILYGFSIRKKLPLSLNLLIWISLILPLCSGSVTSMTRFISIIFPLFLVMENQFQLPNKKYLWLTILMGFHLLSFVTWVQNLAISN